VGWGGFLGVSKGKHTTHLFCNYNVNLHEQIKLPKYSKIQADGGETHPLYVIIQHHLAPQILLPLYLRRYEGCGCEALWDGIIFFLS